MSKWIPIACVADCPPGHSIERVAENRIVALFNVDGTFYALDGVCSHQGGPLADGELHDCIVTCPWHGWQFDVRTGQHQLSPRIKQPQIDVRVDGQTILVDVDEATP